MSFNAGFTGSNGRRESQGSLSSGASLELATSGSGKNEVGQELTRESRVRCLSV